MEKTVFSFTRKQAFEAIVDMINAARDGIVLDNATYKGADGNMVSIDPVELDEFLAHQISLSTNKKEPVDSLAIQSAILATLEVQKEPINLSAIVAATPSFAGFSNQKVSYHMRPLIEAGKVVRVSSKSHVCFAVPGVTFPATAVTA